MTNEEAKQLPHGIYRLHLIEGGTILAAVGSDPSGDRWIAPCNWIGNIGATDLWDAVESAELEIPAQPFYEFNSDYRRGLTTQKHLKIDREI